MNSTKYCFLINTYYQSLEILNILDNSKITPIFHFKHSLVSKLSSEWLFELIQMLEKKFGYNRFQTFVEVKRDYGLFINLVEKKIKYLEVKGDKEILIKLNNIDKTNKVLINPKFSIIDLRNSKNIKMKIKKFIKRS